MTTHRRAWMQRAGVVVALAASALLASPASPALAAPQVQNVSASPGSLDPGETTEVRYTLDFPPGLNLPANIAVSSNNNRLTCVDGCGASNVTEGGPRTARFRYAANSNLTSNATAVITIRATDASGSEQATAQVTLVGKPAEPQVQTVKEVSGKVTDQSTGDPVSGATVMIQDSQNHTYQATSNGSGNFRFVGSTERPISPGQIQLGATKDGATKTRTLNGSANQTLSNQRITLEISAEATPSAEPSAEASEEVLESEAPAESGSPAAADVPQAASEESSGMSSWLLIIVGGLLVALGVGAIVLLWMRRKENAEAEGDESADDATNRPRPAAPGVYGGAAEQTRVAGMPAGGAGDATMVHRPGLADAPTMMHNRPLVDDEFPDPYGAPLPPQQPPGAPQPPAYGGGQGGWDDGYGRGGPPTQPGYGAAPAGGYGTAPSSGGGYGNAPSSGGGYGNAPSSGGGYGGPPTQPGYGAAPAGGYGNAPSSGGGYGNAPSSGGGYGGQPGPAGGYGGGYGNAPSSGGGYGNAPSSGDGYGTPGPRDGEGYGGGRGYGGPADGPATSAYPPQSGGGYGGERYDEPTGRYTGHDPGGATGYGQPTDPYESGSYGGQGGGRHGADSGYGQDSEYGRSGGGYGGGQGYDNPASGGGGYGGAGEGYGSGGGNYGQPGYGPAGGGYDQGGGYGRSGAGDGGYGQSQHQGHQGYEQQGGGGYGQHPGYEQQGGGYYGERDQGTQQHPGGPPQQQGRSERRSLDWLDD